ATGPSKHRDAGSRAWCGDISPTTPCPATSTKWRPSEPRSCDCGTGRSGAAASATVSTGNGCAATRSDGSLPSASLIPGPTSDSALAPKSGAQCVSSARWDLRGGPPARAVPTAIVVDVDAQNALEVAAVEDQEPVETLRAHASDEALRNSVRLRRPHRCL